MITNAQIKKIKTLQRICGLDDDSYRDILRNRAGVNSCRDLRSKRQIDTVMEHLLRLAEKVDKKANQKAADWMWENTPEGIHLMKKSGRIASSSPARPSVGQFQYIWGLWWSLRDEWKKSDGLKMETALNHFLENGRGGPDLKIASWQWITHEMANRLIELLKGRVAQSGRKTYKRKNKRPNCSTQNFSSPHPD